MCCFVGVVLLKKFLSFEQYSTVISNSLIVEGGPLIP